MSSSSTYSQLHPSNALVPNATEPREETRPCPSCESIKTHFQRTMAGSQLYECNECGSAYAAYVPTAGELSQKYESLYGPNGAYQRHRTEVETIRKARAGQVPLKVGWERRMFFSAVPP